jgi:crotonobetainyl-CoA:carnitine CoA-transferase CaiB-like acyl-CoA transferase
MKEKRMQNPRALSGITVLDLSRLLPGPYCSMILADHGAHVIAIEDKRFKADGTFLTAVYRNKEHVSLNLKTEQGREIFYRLAKDADVIIEGFRPGVVQKLGVDYDTVRKINPGIIYCAISGYGQTGSLSDMAGHDVNYLSKAGVLDLIGERGRLPVIPGVQIADIVGGSMSAAIGILLALQARGKTGQGQYIDISITDGVLGMLMVPMFFHETTGKPPRRGNWILSHRFACYNTYETADGRYLSIGAVENRFWKNLCAYFNVPQYTNLQYDPHHRQEIIDFMRNVFKGKTLDEWEQILSELDICYHRIQNLEEALQDPFFREHGTIADIQAENGTTTATIGVPIKLSKTPGAIETNPVSFGESTDAVLSRIGYSELERQALSEKNVI